MDKRKIANARVKHKIEDAVLQLLKTKRFSEITVSDIIRQAHVARSSYYRNYDAKETVVRSYIDRMHAEVRKQIHFSEDMDDLLIFDNLVASLSFYRQQKDELLLLYANGLGMLVQDTLNEFAETLAGSMPQTSIHRYKLYFLTGAMLNMTMAWLEQGAKESPTAMATEFMTYLSGTQPTKS